MKLNCKTFFKLLSLVLVISLMSLSLIGCGNKNVETNSNNEENKNSEYTNRVILVSDMHYTVTDTEEYKGRYANALLSEAAGKAFGYTQEEKIEAIITDIDNFNAKQSIDAVMVLGDLSLDDYGYRNLPDSYLKAFKKDFIDKISYPSYVLAGNHDSYPEAEWKKIMGTDRQYSVKIGNAVFIMLDTFAADTATSASGSTYEGIDTKWLETELKKYPTETIFLCSHFFETGDNSNYELTKLIKNNERIVCMFRGHSHQNAILAPEELNYLYLFDIGGYAYDGSPTNTGAYDFSRFDPSYAWGYQVLEWNDTEVHTYHVKTTRQYDASNGVFDYVGGIEDEVFIEIKK